MRVTVSGMFDIIDFYGHNVMAREFKGVTYVAVAQIVSALGLNWDAQRKAIKKRVSGARCLPFKDADGRRWWMLAVPTNAINDWICEVDLSKVKRADAVENVAEFIDTLDIQEHDDAVKMLKDARALRLGDHTRRFPLTRAEERMLNDGRKYGRSLSPFFPLLGYKFILPAVKFEIETLQSREVASLVNVRFKSNAA